PPTRRVGAESRDPHRHRRWTGASPRGRSRPATVARERGRARGRDGCLRDRRAVSRRCARAGAGRTDRAGGARSGRAGRGGDDMIGIYYEHPHWFGPRFAVLGLPYPAARVINDPADAPAAAAELEFPVVVKPNVGGSGAGIVRFDTPTQLDAAAATGGLELGPDHTALVQEFIPSAEGRITR